MGSQDKRATAVDRERVMRLHEEGLNYQVIARPTGLLARSVSRIVQREKERRAKLEGEKGVRD